MYEWPTRVRTGTPPRSRMISGTALEQMRLCRMVAPGCLSSMAAATRAVVVEPDTGTPWSSTRKQRSASPSKARPTSAPVARIRCCRATRFSGWMGSAGWLGKVAVELAEEDLQLERQALEDRRDHQAPHAVGRVGDDLERLQGVERRRRTGPCAA